VPLKNIPEPAFAADDGSADPALARALAEWHGDPADPAAEQRVLHALTGARLLVPVVAVPGETETDESGLRREKTSDMAVPTLTAPGGRRALPAFTSTEALARWRPDARPVAVPLGQALHALAQEEADTLVLDLAGPVTYQLTGRALHALAGHALAGHGPPAADPAVTAALRSLLAAEPGAAGAHLTPGHEAQPAGGAGGTDSDGTLAVVLAPGAAPAEVARRLSRALAADEVLRARLVNGLELALLPPGTALPEPAFFSR
jgi:hypothetical protein